MNKQQAEKRISKLRQLISDYRYQYHVHNKSTMSEAAADSLKHELSQLEEQFPELITPDSPTQRVAGEPLEGFRQVRHSSRMLSLNDVFNFEELEAWQQRIQKLAGKKANMEYFVDLKMDGLACALIYQDGLLQTAVTRGDGYVGEDITQNVRTMESIPLRLHSSGSKSGFLSGRTEIRGEILMYREDFRRLNEQRKKDGLPLFKNPRNTAAGTMRQLDTSLVAERKLHFHGYDLLRDNASEVPTYEFAYQHMAALGIKVNRQARLLSDLREVETFAKTWEHKRLDLPFGTDGLVVKVNDRSLYDELGVIGKAPRAAAAYKYPAEEATSKVKDIIISVGRTGVATPVAVLEPVLIAGSTVQHASLHNQDEIERLDVRIGDTVIVHKAGDIIPQITCSLRELRDGTEKPYDMAAELKKHRLNFERLEGEVAWRATNRNDPTLLKRGLQHFAAKGAMDIEGLGEKNVELLVDSGLVKDFADIYKLKTDDLMKLERFAETSSENLISAIAQKKSPPLERFVTALGIRHVGIQTAIDLAERFHSLEQIRQVAIKNPGELYDIDGVGEVVAHSIVEWFSDEKNRRLLEKFKSLGVWPQQKKSLSGQLKGLRFAITGTLVGLSREAAAEQIRQLGGTFQSAVGTSTDYLVYGNNIGQSKRRQAESFGTKIIDQQEFENLIKGAHHGS